MTAYVEGFGGSGRGVNRRSRDSALVPVVHAVDRTAAFDHRGRPRPAAALCGVRVSIGSLPWDTDRTANHCKKCARKAVTAP